ncbi:MAG TPA: DUF456 domain-containing protein [Armatimonadetes bacterium]|nr:DUF456 domain-containing protein [Armatimonadota bacterium]
MTVLTVLGYVVFWLVVGAGLLSIPFGLPGPLIIALAALVLGYVTDWTVLSLAAGLVLTGLAVLAEIADNLLGAAGARRYGGSRWGMAGALVGSIVGALIGLPIAFVGSVAGAFLGLFVGALVAELLVQRDLRQALRAGYGAFLGRTAALMLKMFLGVAMVLWLGFALWG